MSTAATAPIFGRAWVFGDRIDTDLLAPGHAMRKPLEELSKHCLEAVRPEFAREVARGDLLVAGEGFGIGSSREQAAQALRFLGVSVVLARSAARIFYRNAFNLGLPVMVVPDAGQIADGARLEVNLATGLVRDVSNGCEYQGEPVPAFLLEIVADGGLLPNLHKRLHGKSSI
ncbi:MAG TPA: 3-isopropylmalate dehydratase [Steroidobacteraceae bacterium]|nr:3-isopropylmalate dehydratase [Steroidobacteraceae bacterium]HQX46982.1 3-isopropylmalate dehydratase [Steroidobacteraceae bacterium]HQX78431.1 3-isopropylmalate dehydratase [Steroidobacteraceae bacterium]HQZ78992.1 3-isopropylmalate dehydratase [Steroidobacteraceae bacterium]